MLDLFKQIQVMVLIIYLPDLQLLGPLPHPGYDEQDQFAGDIPLLRPSTSSIGVFEPQIPGFREDNENDAQDESSSNTRYEGIPQ